MIRTKGVTTMGRRRDVTSVDKGQAQHAGLWLDKYLDDRIDEKERKSRLVLDVAEIAEPKVYAAFFERWKKALADAGVVEAAMREAEVRGRMIVGLGSEAVLETSITLHRTYGVPVIPGSALKGLASSYARRRLEGDGWRKGGKDHTILFGNTESAGYVTFFDALYVPGSGFRKGATPQALWPDVITVHHPKYYMGDEPPADWDSPTPVYLLSATGRYLIALGGPEEWVNAALSILDLALAEEGIGAKTSSGYGRMRIEGMNRPVTSQLAHHGTSEPMASAEARPETISRRGVITQVRSSKRGGITGGVVREEGTNQEFQFSTGVIEGNQPSKKAPVLFKTQGDAVVYLKRI